MCQQCGNAKYAKCQMPNAKYLAPYIFLTTHFNIICIAVTGNKILCLMSYYVLMLTYTNVGVFLP